ncbi:PucR family transcriptional regulator [Thermogemmatispora carboxidivorans]|uniref:PucR family transcriptional regulator n=1 Tax=Thermogemmatispora carboxidivorans TaxID=1382306 RepID=UPI00069B68F0|nr:PucR family transcriptional regulator [Thermogemmatispora carboxidivorans]
MTSPSPTSAATVRNVLTLLASRDAQLVAGAEGLERRVTWALRMRARLPAFESIRGGELALLSLTQLRRLDETLPHLLQTLHREGIAAVAVAAPSIEALGPEAVAVANRLHLPLIYLPASAPLEEIVREVITFVASFRSELERRATEVAHQLMQLSVQGVGIQGLCEYLARVTGKWVVVQDADYSSRWQVAPPAAQPEGMLPISLPPLQDEDALRQEGLARVVVPILIRHEIVGYLSLIGREQTFDYQERLLLGQVSPILALEFVRERERSEVESRYQLEAFFDVVQGNYQQPEEMQARARLLGHDLTPPQVVVVFELSPQQAAPLAGTIAAGWSRRVREELLRSWPSAWVVTEQQRVTALLPLSDLRTGGSDSRSDHELEQALFSRLERVHGRIQQSTNFLKGESASAGSSRPPTRHESDPPYSVGVGRIAQQIQGIGQSMREAQQALEIGRRLFGEGRLHSFARLGIYRLLFHLYGHEELTAFYRETLGPLLEHDSRGGELIETLECFFRCNGNLSEAARAMHMHRNSLLYRLERIEELLGQSLEDSELRLSLQIALKIRYMLQEH